MFSHFKVLIAMALTVIGLGGCRRSDTVGEEFVAESNRLQLLTTPAGARLLDCGAAKRESFSETQEWHVLTTRSWHEYAEAVSRALQPAYRCSSEGRPTTLCSRSLPGDNLQVELVSEPSASGLVVRVRLEAHPD